MTFVKTILTPAANSYDPTPKPDQYVTVEVDLYLSDPSAEGGRGKGVWSTHHQSGFVVPAAQPPVPFTYKVRHTA